MEVINKTNLINLIKEEFPKFISYWESYVNEWGEDLGISNDVIVFSDYVVDIIKTEKFIEIKKIFCFVEFLMCNGNQSVRDAVATSFLEALLHKDPKEIQFIQFSEYLGKETIAYCKAWNDFCGVHTEGIN